MTKNFCDRCKKEITDNSNIKLEGGIYDNRVFDTTEIILCKKCVEDLINFLGISDLLDWND